MVQMGVGGQPIDLMIDTRSEYTVVTQPIGPLAQRQATIVGAMGSQTHRPFLLPQQCNLGGGKVT